VEPFGNKETIVLDRVVLKIDTPVIAWKADVDLRVSISHRMSGNSHFRNIATIHKYIMRIASQSKIIK
jgi:hypothetical protein